MLLRLHQLCFYVNNDYVFMRKERNCQRNQNDIALEYPLANRDTAERELADFVEKTKQARQDMRR